MSRTGHVHCGLAVAVALTAATALAAARTAAPAPAATTGALAFERDTAAGSAVYVASPDGKSQRLVTNPKLGGFDPSWTSTGRLGFVTLRNHVFDLYQAAPNGSQPVRITTDALAKGQPVWSIDGTTIAFAGGPVGRQRIYTVPSKPRAGKPTPVTSGGDAESPSWSPGGALAYSTNRDGRYRIWTLEPGGQPQPLSSGRGDDLDPAWSPDGGTIAFTRYDAKGNYDVWTIDVATREERQLTTDPAQDFDPTWSPDGRSIAFVSSRNMGPDDLNYEIYTMLANGQEQQDVSRNPAADVAPAWSSAEVAPPAAGLRSPSRSLLTCNSGTAGADTLNGSNSSETICGKGGDDTINGNGGNDDIFGGDGNDTIGGGGGADEITGGSGADTIVGGSGGDRIWSRDSAVDTVKGGPGSPGPAEDRSVLRDPNDHVSEVP